MGGEKDEVSMILEGPACLTRWQARYVVLFERSQLKLLQPVRPWSIPSKETLEKGLNLMAAADEEIARRKQKSFGISKSVYTFSNNVKISLSRTGRVHRPRNGSFERVE